MNELFLYYQGAIKDGFAGVMRKTTCKRKVVWSGSFRLREHCKSSALPTIYQLSLHPRINNHLVHGRVWVICARLFLFASGAALLLLALVGFLCWAMGFAFWSRLVLHGGTVLVDNSSAVAIPGRLLGSIVLLLPFIGSIGEVWLIRLGFEGDDANDD